MLACVHTSHPNYDSIRMHDGEGNSITILLVTLHKHMANTDTRSQEPWKKGSTKSLPVCLIWEDSWNFPSLVEDFTEHEDLESKPWIMLLEVEDSS